jgi:hypothetical protein
MQLVRETEGVARSPPRLWNVWVHQGFYVEPVAQRIRIMRHHINGKESTSSHSTITYGIRQP